MGRKYCFSLFLCLVKAVLYIENEIKCGKVKY